MAGIYVHIPFCRKACHYCNFHFSTSAALMPEFVDALLKEIILRKHYLDERVETVYFGGGTPSLLALKDVDDILGSLHKNFSISSSFECTLEANPDDITADKLKRWKQQGINRLSIGIQSFNETDLVWMNRAHTAGEALKAINLALEHGFNITVDLIYGTPGLTDELWQTNVQTVINAGIPHLSCYALTVEAGTALERMISRKKMDNVDTGKQARHFKLLLGWTQAAGYLQYEISNFAKPGFESKHNSSYWQAKPYLGLGPSAHSFDGGTRQWNIANNALYIKSIVQGLVPAEIEVLTTTQKLNEYVMTSLRTIEGIDLQRIEQNWGLNEAERIERCTNKYILRQQARLRGRQVQLTEKGKFFADGIAADLFYSIPFVLLASR